MPPATDTTEARLPASDPLRKPRKVASETLLLGDRELLIQHGDDTYRLCVTRTGKLILQK